MSKSTKNIVSIDFILSYTSDPLFFMTNLYLFVNRVNTLSYAKPVISDNKLIAILLIE